MVRETRSSARKSGTETPNTPATDTTVLFSAQASVKSATPATSEAMDEEDELPVLKRVAKRVSRQDMDEGDEKPVLGKRRRVFVEVPTFKSVVNKRARAAQARDDEESDSDVETSATKSKRLTRNQPSAKAKGKQKEAVIPATDDEAASDKSLEYDEVEESDGSGSEFQASDDEDSDVVVVSTARKLANQARAASPDMDEAEGDMVEAAIQESLRATRSTVKTGGSPSKFVSLSDAEVLSVSDLSEASDSEDEQPLTKKGKAVAKGKGKGKATGSADSTTVWEAPKIMDLTELKKQKRLARLAKASGRSGYKQQEKAMAKELGRALIQSEKNVIRLHKEHPELKDVWKDLETAVKPIAPEKAPQPKNLKVTLLPFQQESVFWLRKQEASVWKGGLLADEMGMGKTIQIIALLVSDGKKPNLVVAPTVAVMQWKNEIEAHTDGLKVLVWHGATREKDAKALSKFDVVLTTYAVLESSFRKQHSGFKRKGHTIIEKSLPHQMKWHRVILDEAHNIKERSTNTAKATFELDSEYKWCLSGTPLQNRVGELYSLIRFIGADPFAYYYCKECSCKSLHWRFSNRKNCDDCGCTPMQHTCFWNNEILSPIQKCGMTGAGLTAFKKLRILLDRLMLRRTKIERADDLDLPPRTVIVRRDYFSPEEKELYTSLFSDAKRQFSTYVDSGTVLNNYSNIFSLLTRMRQMACHPDLVLRSKNNQGKFLAGDDGEAVVCRLCNDVVEDAIKAKCNHVFDRECIKQYLNTAVEQTPACPVCHVPLTIDLEAPALEIEGNATARQGILGRLNLNTWRSSTKIEALIEELSNLRRQDATTKSIVFSQFVNFLDLIAFRLQRAGFVICRLEGNMSPQARDLTIKHFMNNVHVTVFLVSLKAGGVALNLTEANRVYLMDSWWNPAVEFQAMDRIHRLGQHRPVQAIKLVVEDSIESRIVQLQEKKSAMVDATLSTDDSAMGRLTPDDLGFLFRL